LFGQPGDLFFAAFCACRSARSTCSCCRCCWGGGGDLEEAGGPLVARDLQRPKTLFTKFPHNPAGSKKRYIKAYCSHPAEQKPIFMRGVVRKVRYLL
jgi:hypothetical protein